MPFQHPEEIVYGFLIERYVTRKDSGSGHPCHFVRWTAMRVPRGQAPYTARRPTSVRSLAALPCPSPGQSVVGLAGGRRSGRGPNSPRRGSKPGRRGLRPGGPPPSMGTHRSHERPGDCHKHALIKSAISLVIESHHRLLLSHPDRQPSGRPRGV